MSVLILNREQVKQIIRMEDVIREVRNVYRLKSEGQSVIWPLVNHEFADEHAAMDIRSGYIKGVQLHGLKMLNNFPENQKKGLPSFNGIMMVYDSNTGIPISILDATYVTSMRTGAAGALGVDLLARRDARHLFILGAGKQAPFQIAATLLMRPAIDKVYVADTFMPDNAKRFVANIRRLLADDFGIDASGVAFTAVAAAEDLPAAVGDSDAIITVTPSRKPVIQKAWLKRASISAASVPIWSRSRKLRARSSPAPASMPTIWPSVSGWAKWSCPSSRASSLRRLSPARSAT